MAPSQLITRIVSVLRDPGLIRINFFLQGAPVDGSGFAKIANLVQNGKIAVTVNPDLDSDGEFIWYSSDGINGSRFEFLSNEPNIKTIVHEGTHAILVYRGCRDTTMLTHEVAGYLAELHYALQKAEKQVRERLSHKCFTQGSYQHILQEALKLIDRHQLMRKSAILSWRDYQGLRKAISMAQTYRLLEWL